MTIPIHVVVPCMNRLAFLKVTAPAVIAQPQFRYSLVDFSCREGSGDWLTAAFPKEVAQGRVSVVRVPGHQYFHKTIALNVGCRHALDSGADYVCVLDGDTLLQPGFGDWVVSNLHSNEFIVAGHLPDGSDVSCLMGLIVMPAWALRQAGGYDESMHGWGGEDIEMRLRMHLKMNLPYRRVPLSLLGYIDHGDDLREANTQLSKEESNQRNIGICGMRVREWTGRNFAELSPWARDLLLQKEGATSVTAEQRRQREDPHARATRLRAGLTRANLLRLRATRG